MRAVCIEKFEFVKERDAEPGTVFRDVRIGVYIQKYRKQKERRAHEERIYKKFAHIRNMGECVKNM